MKQLIEHSGYSGAAMARAVGAHRSQFNNVINSRAIAPALLLDAIAERLGVTVDHLLHPERPATRQERGAHAQQATTPDRGNTEAMLAQIQEQIRYLAEATKTVPLYQWGTAGDPREGSAEPVGYQQIPPGRESAVGQRGFAVRVQGTSMVRRNIHDGDVIFVNPDRPWGVGSVVLARLDTGSEKGMVVKEVALDQLGRTILRSAMADGSGAPVKGSEYVVIGPVVLRVGIDDFSNRHR